MKKILRSRTPSGSGVAPSINKNYKRYPAADTPSELQCDIPDELETKTIRIETQTRMDHCGTTLGAAQLGANVPERSTYTVVVQTPVPNPHVFPRILYASSAFLCLLKQPTL